MSKNFINKRILAHHCAAKIVVFKRVSVLMVDTEAAAEMEEEVAEHVNLFR